MASWSLSTNYNLTESVFVKCSLLPLNIILECVYKPPSQHPSVYANFCNTVDDIAADATGDTRILLCGGFNISNMDWTDCRRGASTSSDYILEIAAIHGHRQCKNVFNYRGMILDFVLCFIPHTLVTQNVDVVLYEDRHHPALSIVFSENLIQPSHSVKLVIFRLLQDLPFPALHDIPDPEDFLILSSRC